jgi:hypothetical protein
VYVMFISPVVQIRFANDVYPFFFLFILLCFVSRCADWSSVFAVISMFWDACSRVESTHSQQTNSGGNRSSASGSEGSSGGTGTRLSVFERPLRPEDLIAQFQQTAQQAAGNQAPPTRSQSHSSSRNDQRPQPGVQNQSQGESRGPNQKAPEDMPRPAQSQVFFNHGADEYGELSSPASTLSLALFPCLMVGLRS